MSADSAFVKEFGPFATVSLRGTWREMGRAYGTLMSERIKSMYDDIVVRKILSTDGLPQEDAEQIAREYTVDIPRRFREYTLGMAETSGVSETGHLMLIAVEQLVAAIENCSTRATAIAAWGEYSSGRLIYGHSIDLRPWLRSASELTTITILHPSDGSLATAVIGHPGSVISSEYMNERGIFSAYNDAMPSGGALIYPARQPVQASVLSCLLDAEDLDRVEGFLSTARARSACIIGAADELSVRCYEWPVFDIKRRSSVRRPGLMVASNHFTDPSWGLPRPDDKKFSFTRTRRQNLLNLAEHFKGSVDLPRMKQILDTHIDDLGVSNEDTVRQTISVPGELTVSLMVPGLTDWVDIDLREFFLMS